MTASLAEFLLARIEEDQVKRATMREWHAEGCESVPQEGRDYTYSCDCGVPERMARECVAKKLIVQWCGERVRVDMSLGGGFGDAARERDFVPGALAHPADSVVLRYLALPYADHPEFRDEWRP